MDIFNFLNSNFEWLKGVVRYFNFWILVIFCIWIGWCIYFLIHQSEIRRLSSMSSELSLKEERIIAQLKEIEKDEPALNSNQFSILEYIRGYQNETGLSKVIISREGFIFDDNKRQNTNKNIIVDVLKQDSGDKKAQEEFEGALLSIPDKLLKMIPEMRFDSPFVVMITEEGMIYLSKYKSREKLSRSH